MKKLLSIIFLLVASIASMSAQSYISYVRVEDEDMIADLNGAGGVLVLSKRGDLVFTMPHVQSSLPRVSATTECMCMRLLWQKTTIPLPK